MLFYGLPRDSHGRRSHVVSRARYPSTLKAELPVRTRGWQVAILSSSHASQTVLIRACPIPAP